MNEMGSATRRPGGPRERLGLGRWLGPSLTLGATAITALALSGCMGGPMGPMRPGMHPPEGNDARAPSPVAGAEEVIVIATDFSFDPDELSIRAGQSVNLTLNNRGTLYHDLTIEGLGFVLTASGGERGSGSLTVPEPGRYRFVCSVPGHAEAGMTGTLVVTS